MIEYILNEYEPVLPRSYLSNPIRGDNEDILDFIKRTRTICPCCNNDSIESGEEMHNGVGMQQIQPDHCYICNYLQQGAYGLDWGFYQKCWELQVEVL